MQEPLISISGFFLGIVVMTKVTSDWKRQTFFMNQSGVCETL
jgi:hypothetical protein